MAFLVPLPNQIHRRSDVARLGLYPLADAEGFEQGKANLSANFLQYLSKAANSAQATSIFLTKVSFSSEALSMPSQQKPL
jgi:hypothetical protein